MTCNTDHVHSTDCVNWLDDHDRVRTCCNVILYFMGDFGRSRVWTGAMKLAYLAPRLQQMDTVVVLVGDGDDARLGAAARLAEKLDLPFPLIADSQRSLWRRYAGGRLEPTAKQTGAILVNGRGRPVASWPLQTREQSLDLPALLASLETLSGSERAACTYA